MRDIKELCMIVEDELNKIAEKGLTTGNLETAYKLIDIYKDIKNTEYWDLKGEYYMFMMSEMEGDSYNSGNLSYSRRSGGRYSRNSERSYNGGNSGRSHYVRGHYSRSDRDPYESYMSEKQSYRTSGKSEDCKQRMLSALEDHMSELTEEIANLSSDSDCREEREVLSRYIEKLKKMM